MDRKFGKTGTEDFMKSLVDVNDLEAVGMGPACPSCGGTTDWLPCPNCSGDGDMDLFELDPLLFDEGETARCDWCRGKGGHWLCWSCQVNVKVERGEVADGDDGEGGKVAEVPASVDVESDEVALERCGCVDCWVGSELKADEGEVGKFEGLAATLDEEGGEDDWG